MLDSTKRAEQATETAKTKAAAAVHGPKAELTTQVWGILTGVDTKQE